MTADTDDGARFQIPDERRPLHETIEIKLRELIESGELRPGERLPNEADLAAQMKVARGSVRGALQRLETQRVLEVKRGVGWFVSRRAPAAVENSPLTALLISMEPKIGHVLEVRLALETTAIVLAAKRATDADLSELTELSRAHREAIEDGEIDELIETDEKLHSKIVGSAKNDLLSALYEQLVPELAPLRAEAFKHDARAAERSADDHDTILWFLKKHDAPGARVAMTRHMLELGNRAGADAADLKDFIYDSPKIAPETNR